MILTGNEIERRLGKDIFISDFDRSRLNPNSYNLRLSNELETYIMSEPLDMRYKPITSEITIPEEGYILDPGILYLGRTIEHTETHNLVPMIEGRSSIGRLGMYIHVTAGFGDIGFKGYWTLEISVIHPLRIYAGVEICQIFYHICLGDITEYSSGKYQDNQGIQPSLLYKEFKAGD